MLRAVADGFAFAVIDRSGKFLAHCVVNHLGGDLTGGQDLDRLTTSFFTS